MIFDKIVKARDSLKPEYSNNIRVMRAFKDILRNMESIATNQRGTKHCEDGYVWVVMLGGLPYAAYDDPERAHVWAIDHMIEYPFSVDVIPIPRIGFDLCPDDISKGE